MTGKIVFGSLFIENKGRFPMQFLIEHKPQSHEKIEESNKKSSKATASSKDKEDKGKKSALVVNVGPFELSPSYGTVAVGDTALVKVKCTPLEAKVYEESVYVSVNESPPEKKHGNELFISAEGCLPSIDFNNFKTVFREHFVCKDEAELISAPRVSVFVHYIIY